jgi:hypothetical protein
MGRDERVHSGSPSRDNHFQHPLERIITRRDAREKEERRQGIIEDRGRKGGEGRRKGCVHNT